MNKSQTEPVETLIIGGGIGGLAAAYAMARTGRAVHVVEQAPEFTEIGAGLQMGPNASAALDHLGLYDKVVSRAVLPRAGVMRDAITGGTITTLDLGPAFQSRFGYPYFVVHRNDVLEVLLDACRQSPLVTLLTDMQVVGLDRADHGHEVTFKNGRRIHAQLVIGADGLWSLVRGLVSDDKPVFSEYVAFRGTVPTSAVSDDMSLDDVVLWVGPGVHLMQYPVRGGQVYNQVAVIRRPDPSLDTPMSPSALNDAFAAACPAVRRCIPLIDSTKEWPLYDRDPIARWTTDGVALIGDAAHPMLQYLGQGACQALEDAISLARHLATETTLSNALTAYESDRIPRASRCQRSARPWGELWHSADPLTLALRDRVLGQRRPDDFSELDWLYAPSERTTA
ncbi:FAD-dependent monooxygenase [Nocardioides sp. 1609]|uniref:FAD-dependent monooxygenase n=1 Tax=Nocardioides sp. 1609 TaxID=2508327 RepID=UPI00106F6DA9|nr:FAD-dependent monooxygenase [Nocardioides sp. 1609]